MAEAQKLEEQELLLILKTPSRSTEGAGKMIRQVRWRVDGNLGDPGIVKQSYYTANGEIRTGKNEMLKAEDFAALKARWPAIYANFTCPPEFVPTRVVIKQKNEEH